MKRSMYARKVFAWTLCLVMLVSMLSVPALAVEEDAAPAAPAAAAEAPAAADAPAAKAEAPAAVEAPAVKEEAPAAKEETPAVKDETPAVKEETPAVKEETPVKASETPVKASETPVKTSAAPVEPDEVAEPVPGDEPVAEPVLGDEPILDIGGAGLLSVGDPAPASDFVIDWSAQEIRNGDWAGQLGVVETSDGFYVHLITPTYSGAYFEFATPDPNYPPTVLAVKCGSGGWDGSPSTIKNNNTGGAISGASVRYYEENGSRYSEIFVPHYAIPSSESGYILRAGNATFDFTSSAPDSHSDPVAEAFQVDWDQVEKHSIPYSQKQWSVVQGDGGYYLYYEVPAQGDGVMLKLFYAEEPGKEAEAFNYQPYSPASLLNAQYATRSDVDVVYITEDNTLKAEVYLPAELFAEFDFILMGSEGQFLDSADIPLKPGQDKSDLPSKPEPSYDGIVIDGSFHDWDAVPKVEIDDFHNGVDVDEIALVWDGDYVYIYLAENGERQPWGTITGDWRGLVASGPNSNGQFAITTDLGRTLLIQPVVNGSGEPAVAGVDGAKAAANNKDNNNAPHRWELAIPTSALPEYLESFSFGYYLTEPVITNVTNMQDTPGAVDPFKSNVVIDGKYGDWVGYPHSLIEYDTPGIEHHKVDGEGALWSNDGVLYGHVVTEHPDHLAEQGSCFLAAIDIAFNGDREYKALPQDGNFYPRILAIDESGNITDYYKTLNEGHSTPNGTYTYYIFDTRTDPIKQFGHMDENGVWHDATAADLIENAFGIMKVTVTGTKDEAEFELDLEKVAAYIGQDPDTAFKTIDIHWGRIGPQWITTAGTPTGPILGVALAVGAIGAPMCYGEIKKRRSAKKAKDEGEVK